MHTGWSGNAIELLGSDVGYSALLGHLEDRVVDEDVEVTECGDRRVDQLSAVGLVGEVAADRSAGSPCGFDEVDGNLCVRGFSGQVSDDDIGAFAYERESDSPTNPRVPAGDESLSSIQAASPSVRRFTLVRCGDEIGGQARMSKLFLASSLGHGKALVGSCRVNWSAISNLSSGLDGYPLFGPATSEIERPA